MRMVIMGGGKLGESLARIMLERRHTVSLIEKDRARCEKLADSLDASVFWGDGSRVAVLEAAELQDADVFMAVTGQDQDNLVAAQLAKEYFHAKKVIVRANDPRNIDTFQLLGIENVVSSTEVISRLIEQEADLAHMHLVATLNRGKADICSMVLPQNSALDGKAVREVVFPKGTLLISLIRNGSFSIPNGSTVLQEGDELVAVSEEGRSRALVKLLSEIKK